MAANGNRLLPSVGWMESGSVEKKKKKDSSTHTDIWCKKSQKLLPFSDSERMQNFCKGTKSKTKVTGGALLLHLIQNFLCPFSWKLELGDDISLAQMLTKLLPKPCSPVQLLRSALLQPHVDL